MAVTLELDIDPVWGEAQDWDGVVSAAANAVAQVVPELRSEHLIVSVVLGDDAEVHALNAQWRDKDKPTNVLSFPMLERDDVLAASQNPGAPEMLGDIILAHGVCSREASDKAITVAAHTSHLVIHGLLHLAGYDHELGEQDAEQMEALETKALALLGFCDPYAGESTL
jgi:probable rRNA maturation factor